MDFKDMSYILAIARYQNITKAASSLYISQPTLTKFLQKLEKELNQKLFKRMGKPTWLFLICPPGAPISPTRSSATRKFSWFYPPIIR